MDFITIKEKYITLSIKVIPNSKKTELGIDVHSLKLKITAQPIENKANKFVIEYFSKTFKIPKSSIKIIRGETSREKVVAFYITDTDKIKQIQTHINDLK